MLLTFAGEVSREIRYISNVEGVGQYHNPALRDEPPNGIL